MLVLSRKCGEKIVIGNDVTIELVSSRNGVVQIGITAPSEVRVLRAELALRIAAGEAPKKKVTT